MTAETWRDVPGLPYQVSDLGNVRSVDRTITDSKGRRYALKGRLLVLRRTARRPDYLYADLWHAGVCTRCQVHQLVMRVFVGEPPPNHQVHHINHNGLDNRLVNLTYVDRSQHLKTHRVGARNPNAKLTNPEVRAIRRLGRQGAQRLDIAQRFGVSRSTVAHILTYRSWKESKP